MKMLFVTLKWLAIVGVTVAALGTLLYFFGGMWVRTPEMIGAYDQMVLANQAPKIQERFVIPIPGCTCHSDNPVAQAQHSTRRISECMTCH